MKYFFISKDKTFFVLLLGLIIFFATSVLYLFLYILLVAGLMFLFRKNKSYLRDALSNTTDICLSPITGKVISIKEFKLNGEDRIAIKMRIPLWGPYGFHLPFSAKVDLLGKNLESAAADLKFRLAPDHSIIFKSKLDDIIRVTVFSNLLRIKPIFWLKTGDKGRVAACFGYIPFGSRIILDLPSTAEIMINEKQRVRAGQTVIAGLKG